MFDRDTGECPDRWCSGRDHDKPGSAATAVTATASRYVVVLKVVPVNAIASPDPRAG
ncbi:hypothetical protein I552_7852 [Mycobacterium xenopi 3993]|nr:hypothetical protein I552_7852 [Mycobacterium xenopi 3993]